MKYDSRRDSKELLLMNISRASADQRAGRTGRTERGRCYRLYSKQSYDNMHSHTMAEVKRASLVDTCLKIKEIIGAEPISDFLNGTIEPPSPENVSNAIAMLKSIGALNANEEITDLGRFALKLPVDVRYAKAIIYGIAFRCLEPVMYVVSMLSTTSHFKVGTTDEERANIASKRRTFENGVFGHPLMKQNLLRSFGVDISVDVKPLDIVECFKSQK